MTCKCNTLTLNMTQNMCEKIPNNVLNWKLDHAEYFGVCYDRRALKSPSDIIGIVNARRRTRKIPTILPENLRFIKEFLLQFINFSIDDCNKDSERNHLISFIAEIRECKRIVEALDVITYIENKDYFQKRLFTHIYSSSLLFLDMVIKYVKVMLSQDKLNNGLFTELLRRFSSTCYLTPLRGDILIRHLLLGDVFVTSVPDVRYCVAVDDDTDAGLLVGTTSKMIREKSRIIQANEEPPYLIHSNVDNDVLGRHVGELMLERQYSCFKPCVLGVLCVESEMILTCLDMDIFHYEKVIDGGNIDRERALIHYTRPYDILIANERNELIETLLLLSLT